MIDVWLICMMEIYISNHNNLTFQEKHLLLGISVSQRTAEFKESRCDVQSK